MAKNRVVLERFVVQDFKNLTHFINFGPLGQINVIHGPNNVGKSNLLQAIDLFFRLMDQILYTDITVYSDELSIPCSLPNNLGYTERQAFNLSNPKGISLEADFYAEMGRGTRAFDLHVIFQDQRLSVGPDMLGIDWLEIKDDWLNLLNKVLPKWDARQNIKSPYVILEVNRRLMVEDDTPPNGQIVPQQLRDALFDAKESLDTFWSNRWDLFVTSMQSFADILGPGQFVTAFDRVKGQANLAFDQGDVRIPVDLLGSGIQQIVALLGQLLLTPAPMVGIEEPELNLRYSLQKRLLKALQTIVQSDYGPHQLFLTSHSPAFEAEETFFAMTMEDGHPILTQKPNEVAWQFTGSDNGRDKKLAAMYAKSPEPVNYVSSDGLVLLPDRVRDTLALRDGGGITFMRNKKSGRFEVWTTDQLDEWFSGGLADAPSE